MLNIDEDKLKLLLEKKRKIIERPKYSGKGEIISGISLAITLALADFSSLKYINPLYFKIFAWIITSGIIIYGFYTFVRSIVKFYPIENLYSEISDIDPSTEHPFNIILVMNSSESGKYLLFKSRRWSCWLFPNYHCIDRQFNEEQEIQKIKENLIRDLNIDEEINIEYIGNDISKKYSVSDKVIKKYNFHYFQVRNYPVKFKSKHTFKFRGKKYCWKTLDQMYSNKNIVKKNEDVLDYIRKTVNLS